MNTSPRILVIPLLTALILAGHLPRGMGQTTQRLLDLTNTVWRYNQSANLDGVNWFATNFNDAAWPSGRSLLAFESNPDITPLIGTVLASPQTPVNGVAGHAYYFRTSFYLPAGANQSVLTILSRIDDGAVLYLNGIEMGRVRLPSGPLSFSTFATEFPSAGDATVDDILTVSNAPLVPGTNILAVALHQQGTFSTDVVWGMSLFLTLSPPVVIRQPPGVTLHCTDTATLTVAATGSDPLSYRWHKNGVPLADDGRVSGATGPTLSIGNLASSDAANYSVVVSNAAGVVTSGAAGIIVDASSCTPNAWRITSAGGPLAYFTNLTAAQKAAAFSNGWRFTVNSRLVEDSTSFRTMLMAIGSGARRFGLWWDLNSGGNLTARLDGSPTVTYPLTQGGIGARQFHTHELEYNPVTARVTYRFDGQVVTASWTGQLSGAQNGQVFWGAGVGPGPGAIEINRVAFEISGLGLVAAYDAGTQADQPAALTPVTQGWSRESSTGHPSAESPATSINDRFADRLPLVGAAARSFGVNVNASPEPDEPPHAGFAPSRSLWWSWTAPFTGGAFVTTAGSSFDTVLAVYVGGSLANLADVASAARTNFADHVTFRAIAGTTYQIAVDRQDGEGDVALRVELDPTPSNDNFESPRRLTGGNVTDVGTTRGATRQPQEPSHAGTTGGRSIWYQWIAPGSGCVAIETTGSDFDTLLAVYRGEILGALTIVATNDDSGSQVTSGAQLSAVAGTTYWIAVDGYNSSAGQVVLRITLTGAPAGPFPPPNDQFAQRMSLAGTQISTTGSILSATREPNEPVHGATPCGKSVWWQWTCPFSGGVTLSLDETQAPAIAKVYTGTSLTGLTSIPLGQPGGSGGRAIFKAVAGTRYQIVVEGAIGDAFRLSLNLNAAPANDDFPGAAVAPLTGNVLLTTTNPGATIEPGEQPFGTSAHTSGHSVWWKWRASSSAQINVRSDGTDFRHIFGVFTGANVSSLTKVADSAFGQVTFAAVAGQTYYVCVDGLDGAAGTIRLTVQQLAAPANDLFSSRSFLSGSNLVIRASNVGATRETADFEPIHAGISGGKSVWWQWSTPGPGRLFLSTYGSSFDTLLAVYTGPDFLPFVSDLTPLAGNDDYPAFGTDPFPRCSFVAFDYVPRVFPQLQQLYFAVDGKAGASGGIALAVTFVPRPANDTFTSRAPLTGSSATVAGSVVAAMWDNGEPLLAGTNIVRTVWYSWTAPSDPGVSRGAVTLRISGADFIPAVGVFQGGALGTLIAVPTSHQTNAWTSETTFEAVAGATYQIAVGGDPAVDRFGGSFVERAALGPSGTFPEVGSFSLSLEFSTLALRFSRLQEVRELWKLSFSALAEIANYGGTRSRSLRVRLVAVPTSPEMPTLDLGTSILPAPGDVAPGTSVWVPVNGVSPVAGGMGLLFGVRWNVFALLEEYLDGEWLPVAANLMLVVLPTGLTPTAGGVIIPDPPLRGADNCRWTLTSVEVVTPNYFVEGSTNALSFRVERLDSCSGIVATSVLTNAFWTNDLAGSKISTNGVLVIPRGVIGVNRPLALSFEYEFRGVANVARASVPVYNREPVLTAPRRLADGRFRFTINGPPNTICQIEASTNLISWFSLPTTISTDGSGASTYTDTPPNLLRRRFYRTRER